jgi:transposase-like protein
MFTTIKSMFHLMQTFPTEESCIEYMELMLWKGTPVSPFDSTSVVYKCNGINYKCKNTGRYFNVKTGTMYENTKLPLRKWFMAVWLITSHKKGIASTQLARDIGVTQKTAWFLLQRIRACLGVENYNLLGGIVEADESFYGGKNRNRHAYKKVKNSQGRSCKDKTPVLGLVQRGGKLTAVVTIDTSPEQIQPVVRQFVTQGVVLVSDDWKAYKGLHREYTHHVIKHSDGYRPSEDRIAHTGNIEGAWKIMKNSLRDMYNSISRKHLQWYVDEFAYRYNMRNKSDSDKFNHLLLHSDVRTTYQALVA